MLCFSFAQALQKNSGRQIRLVFLFQPWDRKMNFSKDLLKDAATKERTFKEFFHNVQIAVRAAGGLGA